jgi:hypothetical protein
MTSEEKLENALVLLLGAADLVHEAHELLGGIKTHPANVYVSPDDGTRTRITLERAKREVLSAHTSVDDASGTVSNLLDLSDKEFDALRKLGG